MQQSIIDSLRELCSDNDGARKLFEWAAMRVNDANVTSLDVFERKTGMDRASCVDLAKHLQHIGCGKFIVGRRGTKSRFQWDYGLKSIARAGIGGNDVLEPIDPELSDELEDNPPGDQSRPAILEPLSIAEAKRRLAATFGVSVESIDITIRA